MIKYFAQVFRGIHYIIGFSAPPEGTDDRAFVLVWLGAMALFAVFIGILFYYFVPLMSSRP